MQLIGIARIAEMLDLNEAHVRDRLTKRKDFPPAHRIGGALRWKAEDIEDWIESRKITRGARQSTRPARGSRSATPTGSNAPTSEQGRAAEESSLAA